MFEIITEPAKWAKCLAHHADADVFHGYEYVAIEAARQAGRPVLLSGSAQGARVSVALILRPVPGGDGLQDATSVYGYNGVLESSGGAAARPEVTDNLAATLLRLGVVSVFNRGHPFLAASLPSTQMAGETLAVGLRTDVSEYERNLSKSHRYEIRKLAEVVRCESDSTLAHLDQFHALYIETMRRCEASAAYHFPREYMAGIFRAAGKGASLELAWVGDALAAAAMFMRHGRYVHYHLSGSNPTTCRYPATKLLIDRVIREEIAAGRADWLHLGGGVGAARDSLYAFKAGFGANPIPFALTRWIIQPEAYSRLCEQRPDSLGTSFFPAYRA